MCLDSGAEVGVSGDGAWARIRIDAKLDAAALEEVIDRLAACRAAMIPRRTPVMFPGMRIRVGDGVHRQVAEDGELTAVHHPGIGWVGVAG